MINPPKDVSSGNVFLGQEFSFSFGERSLKVFFGNRNFTSDHFDPSLDMRFLKQVHGTKIIESTVIQDTEADGHFTNKTDLGLAINTADCLPVFVFNHDYIFALHAGWRGVKDKIILNLSHFIHEFEIETTSLKAIIGPHVQGESFEVDTQVAMDIFNSLSGVVEDFKSHRAKVFCNTHPNPEKRYLDLSYIANLQLQNLGLNKKDIYTSEANTFSDKLFCSYRRDKETSRNISFAYFR